MDNMTLLVISFALAMDAFAVAAMIGIQLPQFDLRDILRVAFHFGFFQSLNTIIGWCAGLAVRPMIDAFDHWIAFLLLLVIGGRMIYEAFSDQTECSERDRSRGLHLIALSIATSIDALAVGLSFSVLNVSIWIPAVVIGIVALLLSMVGFQLGHSFGCRVPLGKYSDILGGVVLIVIGIHILSEHGVFVGFF